MSQNNLVDRNSHPSQHIHQNNLVDRDSHPIKHIHQNNLVDKDSHPVQHIRTSINQGCFINKLLAFP
ncbi:MAG: hypothetical protein F6K24_09465 [Okeania sp. SIO2D1]|nr:hypothetical protein [Okeania sp. SIO2D1]